VSSNVIDITIRANDETAKGFSSAMSAGSKFSSVLAGVGMAAGQALADLPGKALGFFSSAISAASDLGETVSKNKTVFGAASEELLSWAENAPKAMGLTKQAALDATGSLGNMFTQMGVGASQAAKLSEANVQLASDFASFHNSDPTDVLEAMSAAYRGEYDAVQKFVPLLNAAAVEEKALIMTKKASKDALTAQDKALAVNALMMQGAGAAAGDFARTSDSAANRSRIAGAMFEDLKVKIGDQLLPVWNSLLGFVTGSFLPAMSSLASTLGGVVGPVFQTASDAIALFIGSITGDGADIQSDLGGWANTIIDLGATVGRVFAGIKDAWQLLTQGTTSDELETNLGSWGPTVKEIADGIRNFATQVPGWLDQVKGAWAGLTAAIAPFWDALKGNQNILIAAAWAIGSLLVAAVASLTASLASMAVAVIAATWPFIAVGAALFAVVTAVRYAYENFEWFRTGVQAVFGWLATNVPPILEVVRAAIAVAFEWIVNVAVPWIQQSFGSFMGFMQNTLLPAVTVVWNGIVEAINTAVNFVRPIIDFLVGFIQDNFGHIQEIIRIVWDVISNIISNAWQIISNIIQLGLNLITGNWGAAWDNICNIFSAVWNTLQNIVANGIGLVREVIQGLGAWVGSVAGRLFEGISNAFKNVINWIIDKWNGLSFSTPNIPGTNFGGMTIGVPKIPRLATGGFASGLAIVGERGPELVNLPGRSHVTPAHTTRSMLSEVAASGGRAEISINFGGRVDGAFATAFMQMVRSGEIQLTGRL
jgi:phage-related protein